MMRALLERLAKAAGIAPEGAATPLGLLVLAALLWIFSILWLAVPLLCFALAIGAFFRDPERFPQRTEGVMISGADGRVTDVGEGAPPDAPNLRGRRVSVFMSPLNVHVNRAPVGGEITAIVHTPGEFRAAFSDSASEHNERNLILLKDHNGREFAMVQVAGYLARRIVCRVRPHDRVQAAQRLGLIMFGSRVDHFMPLDYQVTVKVGDRVRAGLTVIGELMQ